MLRLLALAAGLALSGCQTPPSSGPADSPPAASSTAPEAPAPADTLLTPVRPGVWVHTTYRDVEGFGHVRSNGLAVAGADEALLIDAGWGDDAEASTEAVVDAVGEASGVPVVRAVFTHYHDDSVAGLGALQRRGVPTYATAATADLMASHGWARPDSVLAEGDAGERDAWTVPVGDQTVEVFYAGPGHTTDNLVVYVPHARVLYTGCLVRPGDSATLGNTADADIEQWAASVERVRARYGDRVEVVVPSHGVPGGPELLDHTIALVEAHQRRAAGD